MASILFITCNLKPVESSVSQTVAKEFLKSYMKLNPNDSIDFIDVYRDQIQRIDTDVLNAWKKLQRGDGFETLEDYEKKKIMLINETADKFADSDKYVFVTPMWNLGFPAEFKIYIDSVCVAGKSFVYTEHGAIGLLTGKKCLHIHSSGDFHYGKEEDHSVPFLKSVMNFMGVDDYQTVVIEGVDAEPHRAEEYIEKGCETCRNIAAVF